MNNIGFRLILILACFFSTACFAQETKDSKSADQTGLSRWKSWISQQHPEWSCASVHQNMECLWPGIINIQVSDQRGKFELMVEALAETNLPLPGRKDLPPSKIEIRDMSGELVLAPITVSDTAVNVKLQPGKFIVTGELSWNKLPSEIPVPSAYGVLSVNADGQDYLVRRSGDSAILEDKAVAKKSASQSLSVFRRITDDSPLKIETLLRLQVSGGARSVNIGNVLPLGAKLLDVNSSLVYQINSAEELSVQLVPGEHEVRLLALLEQPVSEIKFRSPKLDWYPTAELVAWSPQQLFRTVELAGAVPIDPAATELPEEWKSSAVYSIEPAAVVLLKEIKRGETANPQSNLGLVRTLWLDLSGKGYTVSDHLTGQVNQISRLNALPENEVGRVEQGGEQLLISKDPDLGLAGVELRSLNVDLKADSRIEQSGAFSAVGWNTKVDSLAMNLSLPPSWMLLAAPNATTVSGSWFESWNLFDLFMVLLITLAARKLFGFKFAAILLASLVLNFNEFLSPRIMLIDLLVLVALTRIVQDKSSKLFRVLQLLLYSTLAMWLLEVLTFAKLQFTQFLFPQMQAGTRFRTAVQSLIYQMELNIMSWPMIILGLGLIVWGVLYFRSRKGIGKYFLMFFLLVFGLTFIGRSLTRTFFASDSRQYANYAADSINIEDSKMMGGMPQELASSVYSPRTKKDLSQVLANTSMVTNSQSGPAIPEWQWRKHYLTVAGPVDSDYQIKLWVLSPGVTRTLCALRTILMLLLIPMLLAQIGVRLNLKNSLLKSVLLLSLVFSYNQAQAEYPSPELLKQLEEQMLKELCFEGNCATIQSVNITIEQGRLRLVMQISSKGRSAVAVPGPLQYFAPDRVTLNGDSVFGLKKLGDYLYVKIDQNSRELVVEGALPDPDSFDLQFSTRPLFVSYDLNNWVVTGVTASGYVEKSLRLTREIQSAQALERAVALNSNVSKFSNWAFFERNITIGERVEINSTVRRLGNAESAIRVRIPLLANERVTSKEITVDGSTAWISFGEGQFESQFSSVMPVASEFELLSVAGFDVAQSWNLQCLDFINCQISGIPASSSKTGDQQSNYFLPLSGDRVAVKVRPLRYLEKNSITANSIEHNVWWGSHNQSGSINLIVRATQQGSVEINLPTELSVREVSLNGQTGAGVTKDNSVQVLMSPGSHQLSVSYDRKWDPGFFERAPQIKTSIALHNAKVVVHPSEDRWVLWTGGGLWGPCVLFWAKILMLALIFVLMQKAGALKLSLLSCILLALGFATLPVLHLWIPIGWLVLLAAPEGMRLLTEKVGEKIARAGFVFLMIFALIIIYRLVQTGLVLRPPMLVVGNGSSYDDLRWFFDHSGVETPSPYVVSFPLWMWRTFALFWSGWLVFSLFGWLKLSMQKIGILNSPVLSEQKSDK
jgi:hypothetical protein